MEFLEQNPKPRLVQLLEAARTRTWDKDTPVSERIKRQTTLVGREYWKVEEDMNALETALAGMEDVELNMETEDRGTLDLKVVDEGDDLRALFYASIEGKLRYCAVYEADIDVVVRYLADALYSPEEWVELRDCNIEVRQDSFEAELHVRLNWKNIKRAPQEVQQTSMYEYILSVDAEMENNGKFPSAETEKVVQICCVAADPTKDSLISSYKTYAFVLGEVDHEAAEHEMVWEFKDEGEMLKQFSLFVALSKPDAITGWNVEAFDFAYFLRRAEVLGLESMAPMSRGRGQLKTSSKVFSSSAHGTHEECEVKGQGVWMWDLLKTFSRSTDYKLRSFKLDAVAYHFLKERKHDLGYEEIPELLTTAKGRGRLMRYCIQDALLPLRLIGNRKLLTERIELARNTGATIDMVCRRGLQIRLASLLYREVRRGDMPYVFWTRSQANRDQSANDSYEGATVLDPVKGVHNDPTIVLDFASLYPSIIMTWNLCSSTKMTTAAAEAAVAAGTLKRDDLNWEPGWDCAFVKSHVKVGLLPQVIANLLALRKQAKRDMNDAAEADNSLLYSIYNKRQLAIKMNANGSYGCMGAPSSKFYDPVVAAIITFKGRQLIELTKNAVTKKFTRANGYPYDAHVIYGDTDSVFVKTSSEVTQELYEPYGDEMASYVTTMFRDMFGHRPDNRIVLEFEKVYAPFALYGKKRYGAMEYKMKKGVMTCTGIQTQGMETVRRDNCRLVGETVEHVMSIMLSNKVASEKRTTIQRYLADTIAMIESGNISYHKLIESKQLRMLMSEYEEGDKTPPIHVKLVRKLEQRYGADSPLVPKSGQRIPFVVVEPDVKGVKKGECGEDPAYAWEHKLPLNKEHYIEAAIYGVMARLLEPLLIPNVETKDENDLKRIRKRAVKGLVATAGGAAVPVTKRRRPSMWGKSTVISTCTVCGQPSSTPICTRHTPEDVEEHASRKRKREEGLLQERAELYKTCVECVGGATDQAVPDLEDLHKAHPCESRDCEVLWDRQLNDRLTANQRGV
jgi:DNA polymerase delta subunit 1